jgi:hypothetical protein
MVVLVVVQAVPEKTRPEGWIACKWDGGVKVRQRYQGSSIATSKLHGDSRNLTARGGRQALLFIEDWEQSLL